MISDKTDCACCHEEVPKEELFKRLDEILKEYKDTIEGKEQTFRLLVKQRADLTGDRDHDVRTILTELNRRLEEYIRLHPEQYLWSHRRWRTPRTAGR